MIIGVRRILLPSLCCLALACQADESGNGTNSGREPSPNIIILLADDLGYGDLSSYGHPSIRTPELDRLANEGQRWTDFYAVAPVCSPSRGALMTGKLPVNTGLYGRKKPVMFPADKGGIPAAELTIAEALRHAGYDTAMLGKWHLGDTAPALPTRHGFNEWYGLPYSNDMDWAVGLSTKELMSLGASGIESDKKQLKQEMIKRKAILLNPKKEYWNVPLMNSSVSAGGQYHDEILERPIEQKLLTKRYTERAVTYINNRSENDPPFFLYLAYTMPHVPLFSSDAFANKSGAGRYGDVVEEIDWSVGEIRRALLDAGIAENTLLVFSSDNGPWKWADQHAGSAGPFKQGKGTTFEGGMRVPGIFWWPKTIKPAVVSGIGTIMDIYATALSLAKVEIKDEGVNAIDLTPTLKGQSSPRNTLPYYRYGELYAFRKGSYKLHFATQGAYGTKPDYTVHERPLLFHLGEDPGEQFDLAGTRPEVLADLIKEANQHKAAVQKLSPIFDQP